MTDHDHYLSSITTCSSGAERRVFGERTMTADGIGVQHPRVLQTPFKKIVYEWQITQAFAGHNPSSKQHIFTDAP